MQGAVRADAAPELEFPGPCIVRSAFIGEAALRERVPRAGLEEPPERTATVLSGAPTRWRIVRRSNAHAERAAPLVADLTHVGLRRAADASRWCEQRSRSRCRCARPVGLIEPAGRSRETDDLQTTRPEASRFLSCENHTRKLPSRFRVRSRHVCDAAWPVARLLGHEPWSVARRRPAGRQYERAGQRGRA